MDTLFLWHRIYEIAHEEFSQRIAGRNFWEGIAFSTSRRWDFLFYNAEKNLRSLFLRVLFRKGYASRLAEQIGFEDWEHEVVALLILIDRQLQSTWRQMTFSMRRRVAGLAIREGWSLDSGIRYQGSYGPELYSPERISSMVVEMNQQIHTYWSSIIEVLVKRSKASTDMVQKSSPPILTSQDVWGSPEEWNKTAATDKIRWGRLLGPIKKSLCNFYIDSKFSGETVFTLDSGSASISLSLDGESMSGQCRYQYIFTVPDLQFSHGLSYESLLGLGDGVWDGISKEDAKRFEEDFLYTDKFMRSLFTLCCSPK